MEDPVIQTDALTKRFGPIVAVDNLSFQVPRGQVFGLLGPNGSGKTTTLGMLLSLVKPTSGTIRLFGRESNGTSDDALQRVGAILEAPTFYPYLSGRSNLRYFHGISRRGSPNEVGYLLELVGLSSRADSKLSTYSLGMMQRLGVAYALLGDPELLFLDEPTNGLDPAGMVEVRDLIRQLGDGGRTVLLSSHLLHEVEQVCDRVAILSRGRLISQGGVQELLRPKAGVRLKTTDDTKAASVVSAIPWVGGVRADGGSLVVTAALERSWELTAALAEQGVYVSEMTPIQDSLERFFLEVTGEDSSTAEGEAS